MLNNSCFDSTANAEVAMYSVFSLRSVRSSSMMLVHALMAWLVLLLISLPVYAAENSQDSQANTADSSPISITTQPDNIVDYAEDKISSIELEDINPSKIINKVIDPSEKIAVPQAGYLQGD
ncbi:MAG: hypothetical protein ACR2PP_03060, partial [Psychrobacter sp.]